MATTPLSNGTIYKVTEYDLLSTSIKPNNYYACTDSRKMYKDTVRNTRELLKVTMIDTEVDRLYNTRPVNGVTYYVWETNELWTYNGGWVVKIGEIQNRSSGYYYKNNDTITATDDANKNAIIDNNGLLKDGSVVVRDVNRIIKGKLYIDNTNNNLVVTSFLGGGIRLLPNGFMDAAGALLINPNTLVEYSNIESGDKISNEEYDKLSDSDKENYEEVITTVNDGYALYRGEWNTTDDIYVNTDKYNEDDTSSEIQKYMVWHEGNFDPNDLVLTSEDILHSLQELTKPLDLDVDTVDGMHASEFAIKDHTHETSDITNFDTKLKSFLNSSILGGNNKGISVNYNSTSEKYNFSANDFSLVFTGGATGRGTVNNLSNTSIFLTVDPTMHDHNYNLSDLGDYQDLVDDINSKLDKSETAIKATPNKILYMDESGNLPASITGNSETSSKLKTARAIQLSSGVTGVALFDGSSDINIVATVDPNKHQHNQYALIENIGKTIAPLDTNQTVPLVNLPSSVKDTLQYQGTFDPSAGLPSSTPLKGQYWVAIDTSGNKVINGREYNSGDWIVYNGSDWDYIDNQTYVKSINGESGSSITISVDDLNAISSDYLDYDKSQSVPPNKLILSDSDGHISATSESADKLSNKFSIITTDDSVVYIDTDNSIYETDGTSNLELKLKVDSSILPDLSITPIAGFGINLDVNGIDVQEVS